VDALVNASSAIAAPVRVRTLAAATAIKRKFMTNLLELIISNSDGEDAGAGSCVAGPRR
jgi:hypothetical protein